MREKVKIEVEEFEEAVREYDSEIWEHIEEDIVYTDLSKGYEDIELVIKRKSDGKFFKFTYSTNNELELDAPGLANDFPIEGEEVFPEQQTITVYK